LLFIARLTLYALIKRPRAKCRTS